ncbi:hypothetical protein E4U41_000215 [Claviceps citrina]|nr:hypothetical protein E4U41_000215 [Claviceps citrina]
MASSSSRARKRPSTRDLIPSPFIKRRNLGWTLDSPGTKPFRGSDDDHDDHHHHHHHHHNEHDPSPQPQGRQQPTSSAAHEADTTVPITANPLARLTTLTNHLLTRRHGHSPGLPSLLPVRSLASLYESQAQSAHGSHFVIHQHDHPVAGTHYDLRLQINPSSSASWAIMYGPPGDPNSRRLNRNATETRIHPLWNHLVETASSQTGSLLIWDTGTYAVLPPRSSSSNNSPPAQPPPESQQLLLARAFAHRKIRVRLHGSKLPRGYTLNLRLTSAEHEHARAKNATISAQEATTSKSSRSSSRRRTTRTTRRRQPSSTDDSSPDAQQVQEASSTQRQPQSQDQDLQDAQVVRTNAYPGATNSIGSIHQRRWYLSLDRTASGFVPRRVNGKVTWISADADPVADADADAVTGKAGVSKQEQEQEQEQGNRVQTQRLSFPFYVRGVPHERSVVTGRQADDIMHDEGVEGFVQRKGWKPVLN